MSRGSYRSGSSGDYRPRSYRLQRALEHIAAARRLSAELGGMDQRVKAYFFNLPPSELAAILDEYERVYGGSAREYAANTIPKWRTNRVQMGGMVAERMFNLLPPRMPLGVKYELVEGLWHHLGPSSKHRITVGAGANMPQVIELARAKIAEFVVNYKIPADLECRFDWLCAGDISIKQALLSHIQEVEKKIVIEAARSAADHVGPSEGGRITHRAACANRAGGKARARNRNGQDGGGGGICSKFVAMDIVE